MSESTTDTTTQPETTQAPVPFVSEPIFVVVTQEMVDTQGYPAGLLGQKVINGWTQDPNQEEPV